MIFFNWLAMIPLIVAVGINFILEKTVPDLHPGIPVLIMGGFLLLSDIWLRFFLNPEDRSAFHPKKGGHLMFLPSWLWGIAACALGIIGMLHR